MGHRSRSDLLLVFRPMSFCLPFIFTFARLGDHTLYLSHVYLYIIYIFIFIYTYFPLGTRVCCLKSVYPLLSLIHPPENTSTELFPGIHTSSSYLPTIHLSCCLASHVSFSASSLSPSSPV